MHKQLAVTVGMVVFGLLAGLRALGTEQDAARESWQRVSEIITALGATPGSTIGDIGAGDGYFTARLAKVVGGTGLVYAVDVDAGALKRLRTRVDAEGLANVRVIEGAVDDPHLPPASLDAALIINAYHEMHQYQGVLAGLRNALKPGGRLVIVEPISEKYREAGRGDQTRRHEIAAHFVLDDLRQAGFRIVRFEEEFAKRPAGDAEWLIVASPRAAAPAAAPPAEKVETDDWLSPDVRIGRDEAKRLFEAGAAVFVDVRSQEMYEAGRVQGAQLVSMGRLEASAAALITAGKRVITYCS